jgi:hypothetical protein
MGIVVEGELTIETPSRREVLGPGSVKITWRMGSRRSRRSSSAVGRGGSRRMVSLPCVGITRSSRKKPRGGSSPRCTARIPSRTHPPEHDHALIRRHQVLAVVDRDRPLADLRLVVARTEDLIGQCGGLSHDRLVRLMVSAGGVKGKPAPDMAVRDAEATWRLYQPPKRHGRSRTRPGLAGPGDPG